MADDYSSTFPPYVFEGAVNFGTLDEATGIDKDQPLPKLFKCFRVKTRLNPKNEYHQYFYRFTVERIPIFVRLRLTENPEYTLYMETYNQQRVLIDKQIGNASEILEKIFEPGTYFIRIVCDDTGKYVDGVYCYADVSVEALPPAIDKNKTNSAAAYIGNLESGKRIEQRGRLWSVYKRTPQSTDNVFDKFMHCTRTDDRYAYIYDLYSFYGKQGKDTIYELFPTQEINWKPNSLGLWVKDVFGRYTRIDGDRFSSSSSQIEIAVGIYVPIMLTIPDAYVEYKLNLFASF